MADYTAYRFKKTSQVFSALCMERGAKLHKQKFINLLSNPVYAGKFLLKGTEEEAAIYITGIHEPLISWEAFEKAQLFYRKQKKACQSHAKPELFYLKGHLVYPKCGKLMTGSASKENGGLYAYYHFQRKYGCSNTYLLTKVESAFNELLGSFKVSEEVLCLYAQVLEDVFKTNDKEREGERQRLERDIANIKVEIKDWDERLMNSSLPIEHYNRLVQTMEDQKSEYLLQLSTLSPAKSE
jgi:site-specific DNA recombinase